MRNETATKLHAVLSRKLTEIHKIIGGQDKYKITFIARWIGDKTLDADITLSDDDTEAAIQTLRTMATRKECEVEPGKECEVEPLDRVLTPAQKKLKAKHGTPAEFAAACYKAVPGDISMDEAADAIREYCLKWDGQRG